MPRPRKPLKFATILDDMDISDLKNLKEEIATMLRIKDRALEKRKRDIEARKMRDRIKIGQTVTFMQSGSTEGMLNGDVVAIFEDKVQIKMGDKRRSVALARITNIE